MPLFFGVNGQSTTKGQAQSLARFRGILAHREKGQWENMRRPHLLEQIIYDLRA